MKSNRVNQIWFSLIVILVATGCNSKKEATTLFERLSSSRTGIDFRNDLEFDQDFNIFNYRNYYNGGGVALGDVNNDNLIDIYFTSNLGKNKLYLNKGNFHFEDISESAGVGGERAWSTGVTMVDINADGFLDIYVCNSGNISGDNKQNELFINNGDLTFTESAEAYGLDDSGYTTHASFFDYDKDGDLDAYILNNSFQAIGSFNLRRNERPVRDSLGGDKLMRNDNGYFVDVSESAGIYGSIIGFGLGVTVGDLNGDRWDDIYVSNDFFERDYLYINQQDGTFKEELTEQLKSISIASMGADLVDVDNDGNNDLFVTEMLPSEHSRLKSVTAFETYDRYQYVVNNGYYHQFPRNTFQKNNGDGTFSEIGRMVGIEASDWSWGALFFDMNNDGLRDLFIANGIYQDLTDQDYLQYISTEEVMKSVVSNGQVDYEKLVQIIPSNPVPNHAYLNEGNLHFQEKAAELGLGESSFSNGSAYGDLDNDGDLDLVINNVNMEAWIYRNQADQLRNGHYLKFKLIGEGLNRDAIGASIEVQSAGKKYYLNQQPVRGYQSCVDPHPIVGLPDSAAVDVTVYWPKGGVTKLSNVELDQEITLTEKDQSEREVDEPSSNERMIFSYVGALPDYVHEENEFVDFDRDRLLYHMKSTESPKISVGDVNGDGMEDLFVGSARGVSAALFLASGDGFQKMRQPAFEEDKVSEDGSSIFFDADNDGDLDLYVCSGGTEFSPKSPALLDRLYWNDGKGIFTKSEQGLPVEGQFVSTSSVSAGDLDGDGDVDLFVGEHLKPFDYGAAGDGFLLINDGKGNFSNQTEAIAPELKSLGMITGSCLADFDGDGDLDLAVAGEFMGIYFFQNQNGKLKQLNTSTQVLKGWWSAMHVADLDGDGDLDLVMGNLGLNSRFKASAEFPIHLYVKDFDQNGFTDPILTGYQDGNEYAYALRHNLIDQMKGLKKRFPDYKSYKDAKFQDIFSEEELSDAIRLETTTLQSLILYNKGDFHFEAVDLPLEAQLSPVYAIESGDFDGDGDLDLITAGNLYAVKPEVGRYDASFGCYLEQTGSEGFQCQKDAGFKVDGEVRGLKALENRILVSRNSDSIIVFKY